MVRRNDPSSNYWQLSTHGDFPFIFTNLHETVYRRYNNLRYLSHKSTAASSPVSSDYLHSPSNYSIHVSDFPPIYLRNRHLQTRLLALSINLSIIIAENCQIWQFLPKPTFLREHDLSQINYFSFRTPIWLIP